MPKQMKSKAVKNTKSSVSKTSTKKAVAPKTVAKKTTVAKAISKKVIAPKSKATAHKPVKTVTAKAVVPASTKAKKAKDQRKQLDLCLLLDCTSSMYSWIQRSKDTLKQIINKVKEENENLCVRVCFVGYRDIKDTHRFTIHGFTEDLDAVKTFISKVNAEGGADMPEDVQGGFNKAFQQDWGTHSIKQCFLICDAPGHGKNINGFGPGVMYGDDYPNGSPDGFKFEDQMKEFARREINFTIVKVNESCNKMIQVMQNNFDKPNRALLVTDLAEACRSGSQTEVTEKFVSAASFMLSVAVGGKPATKGGKKTPFKAIKRETEPLWDTKQFQTKQWLSQTAYLTVRSITGTQIRVENSYGSQMDVSKDILERMWSASHFEKEICCTMTELAELLESIGDTVFSIQFKKKPNEANVADRLKSMSLAEIRAQAAELSKELIDGETCTMVCKLIDLEPSLGRSTVIDFSASTVNKFRQIDHRTINNIVFKNVRYILKRSGSKKSTDEEMVEKHKKGDPKWNYSSLVVGNTFSGTAYFKIQEALSDNKVLTKCDDKEILVSRDILEYEMNNANVFASEEKVPLTKIAQILESEVHSTCFTVCFNCKVDEKEVKSKLASLKKEELSDAKKLAKEILSGKETTLVGHIAKSDSKMGRTLMIELNQHGFRQIDHRSIKWFIVKNVKYVVGK